MACVVHSAHLLWSRGCCLQLTIMRSGKGRNTAAYMLSVLAPPSAMLAVISMKKVAPCSASLLSSTVGVLQIAISDRFLPLEILGWTIMNFALDTMRVLWAQNGWSRIGWVSPYTVFSGVQCALWALYFAVKKRDARYTRIWNSMYLNTG